MGTAQSEELRKILSEVNVIDSVTRQRPKVLRTWFQDTKPLLDWKGDNRGTYTRTEEGRTLSVFIIDGDNALSGDALETYLTENGVDVDTEELEEGHAFSIAFPALKG